jgi:ferredoxin, 2Fe-2S
MLKITFVEFNGTEHVVDASSDRTVMEAAIKHGVPGIEADCGGACACATCHVYVDPRWSAQVGKPSDNEQAMLEFANDVQDNSRLSCQIQVTPALDGLTVKMPKSQR